MLRFVSVLAALSLCALPATALPGANARSHRLDGATGHKLPMRGLLSAAPVAPGMIQLPHLFYYGGHVLSSVKVVAVYWNHGTYFTSADGVAFRSKTDEFYAAFVHGPQFDWLSEYSTNVPAKGGGAGSNQTIGAGTYSGGNLITPAVITGATFSSPDIVTELSGQIDAHHLPANDGNTLYVVHFPPGVSIVDGSDQSCQTYCAFHDSLSKGGVNVFYAAIPDHSTGGCVSCGESTDWYSNMTASASHEVVESVTDPEVGAASPTGECGGAHSWCDPLPQDTGTVHNEIGDICEGERAADITEAPFTSGGKTWVIQREWSNQAKACITNRADAFTLSVTPPALAVHAAGTYDFTISSSVPASGAVAAALSLRKLPAGVSGTFDSPTLTTGGSTGLHLTIGADASSFNFGVFAESGPTLAMAVGGVIADDFTAGTTTTNLSLKAGGQATLKIDTTGSSAAVNVQVTGSLPGLTSTASPATIQSGQSSTITVAAAAGTPSVAAGTLTFTLTNGLRVHAIRVTVQIDGDDFDATDDAPAPLALTIGGSAKFQVTTRNTHGNAQTLTFSGTQLPPGVTMTFDPPSVTAGGSTTATVRAGGGAPAGQNSLQITVAGPVASSDLVLRAQLNGSGCGTTGKPLPWLAGLLLLFAQRRRRKPAM